MSRKRKIIIAVSIALLGLVGWLIFRDKTPEVPLGVEHAVTIAYSGPELMVAPYRFGVPVNVRIAEVIEKNGVRTYDIRYMLNTSGEFNIIEYLTTRDGSPMGDLPAFKVRGLETLSKSMDQQIETIEESGIEIWHHYYQVMTAIIALWIGWLLLLIFWRRNKPEGALDTAPEPSFHELMESYLRQIESETINDQAKARMEMLLIHRWRDELGFSGMEMHEVVRRIRSDEQASGAFSKLQEWLHNPNHSVKVEELLESLRPLSVKPEAARQ